MEYKGQSMWVSGLAERNIVEEVALPLHISPCPQSDSPSAIIYTTVARLIQLFLIRKTSSIIVCNT